VRIRGAWQRNQAAQSAGPSIYLSDEIDPHWPGNHRVRFRCNSGTGRAVWSASIQCATCEVSKPCVTWLPEACERCSAHPAEHWPNCYTCMGSEAKGDRRLRRRHALKLGQRCAGPICLLPRDWTRAESSRRRRARFVEESRSMAYDHDSALAVL
jgi:hypothetical protein